MSPTSLASQAMRSLVGDDFQHMIASTDYDTFILVGACLLYTSDAADE